MGTRTDVVQAVLRVRISTWVRVEPMDATHMAMLDAPLAGPFRFTVAQVIFDPAPLAAIRVDVKVQDTLPFVSKTVLAHSHVMRLADNVHVVDLVRAVEDHVLALANFRENLGPACSLRNGLSLVVV